MNTILAMRTPACGVFPNSRPLPAILLMAVLVALVPCWAQTAESTSGDDKTNSPQVMGPYEVTDRRPFRDSNTDIVRSIDDPQPYYIFDANTIDHSGASTIEDFLNQRLPMNTTAQIFSQRSIYLFGTGSSVNLRGLGTNQTLILINGRRTASITEAASINQFDLNGIPLAAIDRIEVLPSSASAIYGGSAMGGVINIVLKKNYSGGEIDLRYENTATSDAPLKSIDVTQGISFEGGKTRILVTAHYSDQRAVILHDRTFLTDYLHTIMQNNPTYLSSVSAPFNGATPNITTGNAATNLTLKNGTPLNSPITYVAPGTSPSTPASTLNAGLVANAGSYNLAFPQDAQTPTGLDQVLGAVPRVKSLLATLHRDMTSKIEVFGEFSYSSNLSHDSNEDPFASALSVPATAPSNPFQQAVRVSFPNPLRLSLNIESISRRVTTGMILKLPRDWVAEADYTWNQSVFGAVVPQYAFAALSSAVLAGTVNPFVDTLSNPPDLAPYLGTTSVGRSSTVNDLALRSSGPVVTLPAGELNLTVGLEHRKEGYSDAGSYSIYPYQPSATFASIYLGKSQTTDSLYAEAEIPVISSANKIPGVRQLDLQLAVRDEAYTVNTGTIYQFLGSLAAFSPPIAKERLTYSEISPTMGLSYKPVAGVTLRASYARAFLPPTVFQFVPNAGGVPTNAPVVDPLRGNTTYTAGVLSGGSPSLRPQKSDDWDLGVIWEPDALKGFRGAINWYHIKEPNAIVTLPTSTIINNPSSFPGRVVRGPIPSGDPYGVGPITFVDDTLINLTELITEGFDLSLGYRFATAGFGTFNADLLGTFITHYSQQTTFGSPFQDITNRVGDGGPLKLKANANLTWELGPWLAGWTAHYYGSYPQVGALGDPTTSDRTYVLAQGSASVPSQLYHDAFVGYRCGNDMTKSVFVRNLEIQVGIKNVFNEAPPLDAFYNSSYYYSPFGDPRLRSFWLALKKHY